MRGCDGALRCLNLSADVTVVTSHDQAREVPQAKAYEFLRVEGAFFPRLFNQQHTVENGETSNISITSIMLKLSAVSIL